MATFALLFISLSWFATVFVLGEAMEKAEKKLKEIKKASAHKSSDLKNKVGQGA